MTLRKTLTLTALLLLNGLVVPSSAQIPDEFTNLRVLPKDIGKRELVDVMRGFSGALGVRCTHCHKGPVPGSLEGVDFATDDLEPKRVARSMIKLVGEINGKLLPASGRDKTMQVRCVTCHRGLTRPETLEQVLLAAVAEGGSAAAAGKYEELREQYYGSGSYDFGPGTLNTVAETLAQEKNDLDGAIALMRVNVEANPEAAYSHLMLGQLLAMKGDKQAAAASIERSLALEPDNPRARQMLERLRAPE